VRLSDQGWKPRVLEHQLGLNPTFLGMYRRVQLFLPQPQGKTTGSWPGHHTKDGVSQPSSPGGKWEGRSLPVSWLLILKVAAGRCARGISQKRPRGRFWRNRGSQVRATQTQSALDATLLGKAEQP
jgi:hypothetical protein